MFAFLPPPFIHSERKNQMYYIVNDDGEYWNNDMGWVEFNLADQFTKYETAIFNLPMGGKRVQT